MMRALLVLLLVLARPALAAPALWVVHGSHAAVYLLGSMHLMRPDASWESPAIDRAFDESQECWFEVDMSARDNLIGTGTLLLNAFDFSHRLSERLSPEAWRRLGAIMDSNSLEHVRPWLVATMLGLRQWSQAGFTAEAGVERVLMRKAKAAGKPVHGIETAQSQMRLLADMPDAEALPAIERMLVAPVVSRDVLDQLATRWLAGDPDGEIAQVGDMMRDENPVLARRLLTDRNVVFADAVMRLLDGDKTVLLTVGAAHMAGSDGVPALLERRGLTVARIY